MEKIYIRRFIKGVVSTSLGTLLSAILGFVNIYIAVRFIPKEQFGTFLLLQVVVYSLVMMCDLGINISTTKFVACANVKEKSKIINTVLQVKGVVCLVVSLFVFVLGHYLLSIFKSEGLEEYVLYLIILFVLESFNALLMAILQGLHLYKKLAFSQVLLGMSNLAFMVVLLFVFDLEIFALIFAKIFSVILVLIYQASGTDIKINKVLSKDIIKAMVKFGYPLGFNNVLTFVFMKVDRVIIGTLLNTVGVAYYGAASKIPDAVRQMFEAFRTVYFPNMAELFTNKDKEGAEKVLNNALRLVSLVSTMGTLIIFLFQDEIVVMLFSIEYLQCAPVLSLLMVAMSVGLVGYLLGTSLVAAGYSKLPVLINIVDAFVAVTANLFMIPKFGILGAAYAGIMARSLTLPFNIFFLKKHGLRVDSIGYLKPLFILGVCLAISTLQIGGLLFKVGLILLFIVLSVSLSVVTRSDFLSFIKGIRSMQGVA